ncbi:hypothetical protein MHBO_001158 [Bonamia ostreae]|uniref:Uncharacterized protein n=1 Tax=Bonamia ostreae TaxID=126728 RepID=A0ABV2AI16_9EUKA
MATTMPFNKRQISVSYSDPLKFYVCSAYSNNYNSNQITGPFEIIATGDNNETASVSYTVDPKDKGLFLSVPDWSYPTFTLQFAVKNESPFGTILYRRDSRFSINNLTFCKLF